MSEEEIDYAVVLADLRARRARLDSAIHAIEQIMGTKPAPTQPSQAPAVTTARVIAPAVSKGVFSGMTIGKAGAKFLRITMKPQTTAHIAEALEQGGIDATAANFKNSVYTALVRGGEAVRVRGKWTLREWRTAGRGNSNGVQQSEIQATAVEAAVAS